MHSRTRSAPPAVMAVMHHALTHHSLAHSLISVFDLLHFYSSPPPLTHSPTSIMTEYWVSQSKYYCKFCKQWMADNKATRQLHDLSEKHKSQVEYFHKKKSDDKLHGAR